jgi:quercetin dioxygenase-like cupin family protein/DNA-binding XRE family transcriptional regulator
MTTSEVLSQIRQDTDSQAEHTAKTVGSRLRSLRKNQKVTLVELAKASGVDAATISRIETGRMTGTLESHVKLVTALGEKLTALYSGIEDDRATKAVAIQSAASRTDVYVHQAGKFSTAMLTSDVLKKKLMPVLISIEPGGTTHREETRVGTEKFLYVLEGKVEAHVGDAVHLLKGGSTLYFDASIPHTLANAGRSVARCLSVVTPPVL